MSTSAFAPCALVETAVTTTPASDGLLGAGNVVRIANAGSVVVLATTYTAGDTPGDTTLAVLGGTVAYLSLPNGHNELQLQTASGTATVYFNRGYLTS